MNEHTTSSSPDSGLSGLSGMVRRHRWPVLALSALALLMFIDVLVRPGRLLSLPGADLSGQFLGWREFGFGQLRQGHLPLWNPYLFGGIPYVGGFQSALFYPPNWLHLLLPAGPAINLLIAAHTLLAGLFMYAWAIRRGLASLPAMVSGALLMFCGAGFLHIAAGHLSNLYAMAWVPLVFLVVDELSPEAGEIRPAWVLVGVAAVAMQILAGHPQYVFYTGIASLIYAALRIQRARRRVRMAGALGAVFLGGAALSAVQLVTGLAASGQSVRAAGLPFEFAAMFSLPPENALTLLAPGFFGSLDGVTYWGRCYFWEMCLFFGVTGMVLALYGAVSRAWEGSKPLRRSLLPAALILMLLALGSHTPLLEFLHGYVPGFSQFRGSSKFIWQASVLLVMLAGIGLHQILQAPRRRAWMAGGCLAGSVGIAIAAFLLRGGGGRWQDFMSLIFSSQESYLPQDLMADPAFMARAALQASNALLISAGTLALVGLLLALAHRSRRASQGIALLAVVEVFVFARAHRPSFEMASLPASRVQAFCQAHPGDYRVMNLQDPNSALSTGIPDVWGNDPGVSLRYAQFMAHTQGESPDRATQYLDVRRISRLYPLLRLGYLFTGDKIVKVQDPLPRASLYHECAVEADRDRLLKAMDAPEFDPAFRVMLETRPDPAPVMPVGEVKDAVRILGASTDHLDLEVEAGTAGILLLTDAYDKDWRARPLDDSAQSVYQVLPANYMQMGIPVKEGRHRLRLEYAPAAFRWGLWISALSLAAYLGLAGWIGKQWRVAASFPEES